MFSGTKHSPRQMIEALKRVASLPGAEADRPALLDVVRCIAEITASASQLRTKSKKLEKERLVLDRQSKVGTTICRHGTPTDDRCPLC